LIIIWKKLNQIWWFPYTTF